MLCKKEYYLSISTLVFTILIDALGVGLFWPLFGPLFTGEQNTIFSPEVSQYWRDLLYGLAMGIYPLMMFLGTPILGDLSDLFGRKKLLLFCLYSTSFGIVICFLGVLFRSVVLIILSRAWLGFLSGSAATAQAAIIDISDEKKKAVNLALISFASQFGFVIGPLLGGILISGKLVALFGIQFIFLISALMAFCNATALIFTFKETFHRQKKAIKIKWNRSLEVFLAAWRLSEIRVLALVVWFFQTGVSMLFQLSILFLISFYHYDGSATGHYLSMIGFFSAISSLFLVRVFFHFFSLRQILLGSLASVLLGALIALGDGEISKWVALLPFGIGYAVGGTALTTSFSNIVAAENQGWAMGVSSSFTALGWAGGAFLAGSTIAKFGYHSFWVVVVLFSISLLLAIFKAKVSATKVQPDLVVH